MQRVFHELSNISGRCLMVLDNADEKDYCPTNVFCLRTGRYLSHLGTSWDFEHHLPRFLTEGEALELFFEHCKREQHDELAMAIINAVDLHTLTVGYWPKRPSASALDWKGSLLAEGPRYWQGHQHPHRP
ncbi:MAG: hypothetical protein R2788_08560 [Saprospiraceae bacterium]